MDEEDLAPAASKGDHEDVDTIATRTRTKFSLVDVPIDTLEASLPDTALDLTAPETEEDREYQRFLSSLLPNEQVNLSFLDEEDEEYCPEEDDDDHEDDEARRGISKKELTDLLLDSTHMAFPKATGAVKTLEPRKEVPKDKKVKGNEVAASLPVLEEKGQKMRLSAANAGAQNTLQVETTKPAFKGRHGEVTQEQCIQLASQMHKHLQLLLQSYHLLAKEAPTPALTECRAMIEELQLRGEKALRYKNTLLSKLNPAPTGATTPAEVEGSHTSRDASTPRDELSSTIEMSGSNTTENLLALRRVTRSLTAAHAAVAHPSMFELVGSQTVDELSATFARGCSLEERNHAIQEQMLQLDTHLLSAKKRKKTQKGFSMSEDSLLADGVKRFGAHTESWQQIQKHFLPLKNPQHIRQRYKYLTRKKSGKGAVNPFFQQSSQVGGTGWLLEEDVRIARGLVELHDEKHHFAKLAKSYLPHRSRLQIRKRWERITAKFRAELAEVGLVAPDDNSLDLAVAMKEYLEDKLRERVARQRGEAEMAKFDAALQLQQLGRGIWDPPSTADAGKPEVDANSCKVKNLHPALFFSSWSFISPATLLNSTCKHNWPSFMDEQNESKNDSHDDTTAVADIDVSSDGLLPEGLYNLTQSLGGVQGALPIDTNAPLEMAAVGTTAQIEGTAFNQSSTPLDNPVSEKDGGDGDEEEDDSDYEHDELLSSDSDSDFEQMELSDDDNDDEEDEGSVDTIEHDTLVSDSDDQSAESGEPMITPSQSPQQAQSQSTASASKKTSSQRIHHPLRLQNLGQPGNERMKRALAALERRIAGKSLLGSTASATSDLLQRSVTKRPKRKVPTTLVTPLGVSYTNRSNLLPCEASNDGSATAGHDDSEDEDDWDDGSGDEGFEVDELPSSSDELSSGTADEDNDDTASCVRSNEASGSVTPRRRNAANDHHTLPNKKPKLQPCPTCEHTTCTCSSSARMQLLLRRMKEKRSSSRLS